MGEEPTDVFAVRRHKLEALRKVGIDPFPHVFDGVEPIASVRERHGSLAAGEETADRHRVAGRIAARRGQGRMAFLDLVDRSGRIQLQARVDELADEGMAQLLELDLGDLIGVDGIAFSTRRGELTLRVERWELLAKSLRPPPEKHHGLRDVEVRQNQAYLSVLLVARTVTRIGEITEITPGLVEGLYAGDFDHLQRLYERINSNGESVGVVTCPNCSHQFEVDMTEIEDGGLGE